MSDRRDDDAGAIAWPGFVDILSAVIIMFVFFVMITAIVMYVLSVEYQQNLEDQNEERLSSMVAEELKDFVEQIRTGEMTVEDIKEKFQYEEQVKTLENENVQLTRENLELSADLEKLSGTIEQIKADFAADLDQSTMQKDNLFVIVFSRNDISLSEETADATQAYIKSRIKAMGTKNVKVRILAPDNPNAPTISVSRELALARSLNVRNVVLKADIPPQDISVTYTAPEAVDDSYNWVKILVIEK